MQETVIKLEHITREFPGVLANDDVSLEIHRGEVFALVGENGAGKSTLINIIYGIFPPTDGSVYIRGKKVETFSPKNAIDMGIGMVHQHFMLVPSFTVAQNIVMSREPRRAGLFFDNRRAEEITRELVREYGLNVDPSAQVQDISVGVQQRVEILKALYRGADILILDEPTAVLTPQETAELFRVIRHIIKEKNMTVILITHKLGEVMAISCLLGWVVAKVSLKLKNKSFVTVVLSLVFFGLYYYFFSFKATSLLTELLQNIALYGDKVRSSAYPVYLFGQAGAGDPLSMLLLTVAIAVLFGLTWLLLPLHRHGLRPCGPQGLPGQGRPVPEHFLRPAGPGAAPLHLQRQLYAQLRLRHVVSGAGLRLPPVAGPGAAGTGVAVLP